MEEETEGMRELSCRGEENGGVSVSKISLQVVRAVVCNLLASRKGSVRWRVASAGHLRPARNEDST